MGVFTGVSRRMALSLPLWLAACGESGPPRSFAQPRYDFLTPLRLNVASLEYAPLPAPGPLADAAPFPPAAALQQMAQDRLSASGSSGRAVVTIEEARVVRAAGGLDGSMGLHLDVFSADGRKVGYAEARVVRRAGSVGSDLRGGLYDLVKQMLDDMNVELEFQIRRSLRDYLQTTSTAPPPVPVQQQDLAAPRS